MIWNFGEVYKFIRKSKGLSQSDICSDELSRSTLSKIENNKLMPSFQIMDYLLKQINMTFDEFEYICNRYKPSTRYILIGKISSSLNNYKTSDIKKIILECQEYLKVNNDLYIESLIDILMLKEQLSNSHNINQSIEEIAESMYFGTYVERIYDVGVSGIHRLLAKVEVLQEANCVVAVAGMEGALASVIGGLVSRTVIAVPTSVGYGASMNGLSALLTMINSCANGVSVVNIDNGYGAGYLATQINNLAEG